jgi:hypothetical protein
MGGGGGQQPPPGSQGSGSSGRDSGSEPADSSTSAANAVPKEYNSPIAGAETFLKALASKDPKALADAVALRSRLEASTRNQKYFEAILEENLPEDMLDELVKAFEGMAVQGMNQRKSTNVVGVIVGKTDENGSQISRTLTMRKEKAGWKVQDISDRRVVKAFGSSARNQRSNSNNNSGGGNSDR